MALYEIGFTGKYALEEYLDYLGNLGKRDNIRHILMDCLYIPAAGLLFTEPALGIFLLFVVLVINIMTYFKEKGEVNPYLVSFAYILRMIRGAEKIKGVLSRACRGGSLKTESAEAEEVFLKYQDILEKDIKVLGDFKSFSQVAMSMSNPMGGSGPLDLLFDYLKMALHLDLMKFNQILIRVEPAAALAFSGRLKQSFPVIVLQRPDGNAHFLCYFSHSHVALGNCPVICHCGFTSFFLLWTV